MPSPTQEPTTLRRVYATSVEDGKLIVMGSYDDASRRTWPMGRVKITYVKQIFDYNTGTLLEQTEIKSRDRRYGSHGLTSPDFLVRAQEINWGWSLKNEKQDKKIQFLAEALNMFKESVIKIYEKIDSIELYQDTKPEAEERLQRPLEFVDTGTRNKFIAAYGKTFSEPDLTNALRGSRYDNAWPFEMGFKLDSQRELRSRAWCLGAHAIVHYQPGSSMGTPVRFKDL